MLKRLWFRIFGEKRVVIKAVRMFGPRFNAKLFLDDGTAVELKLPFLPDRDRKIKIKYGPRGRARAVVIGRRTFEIAA